MDPAADAIGSEEAARLLRIAQPTLQRLLAEGGLPSLRRQDLLAWRDRHATVQAESLVALAALSEAHGL